MEANQENLVKNFEQKLKISSEEVKDTTQKVSDIPKAKLTGILWD